MESLSLAEVSLTAMSHDEVVVRACAGCMPSFDELVGRYDRRLTRYVQDMLRRCRGRAGGGEAEDIVQETWLRALRSLGRYDARWAFSTWLFTIARRSCLTKLRTAGRARALDAAAARSAADDGLPGPLARAMEAERARHLWNLVSGALPQRQATAVRLHYREGMAIDEIATAVGTSPGAVKLSLFRARRRLATVISSGFLLALAAMPAALPRPWRPALPTGAVAPGPESVAVELLPTPHDLREALLVQGSALAARALGLPAWNELAALAPRGPDSLPLPQ